MAGHLLQDIAARIAAFTEEIAQLSKRLADETYKRTYFEELLTLKDAEYARQRAELQRLRDDNAAQMELKEGFFLKWVETTTQLEQLRSQNDKLCKQNEALEQRVAELEQRPQKPACGLPELARAALEQVRRWDSDTRMNTLSQEVRRCRDDIERLEYTVGESSKGVNVTMLDFWKKFYEY